MIRIIKLLTLFGVLKHCLLNICISAMKSEKTQGRAELFSRSKELVVEIERVEEVSSTSVPIFTKRLTRSSKVSLHINVSA